MIMLAGHMPEVVTEDSLRARKYGLELRCAWPDHDIRSSLLTIGTCQSASDLARGCLPRRHVVWILAVRAAFISVRVVG